VIIKKIKIIYIRGNHDNEIKNLFNLKISNIEFADEYYIETNAKRYLVMHGDKLENPGSSLTLIYKVGSVLYDLLLVINKLYNKIRLKFNLPYKSISKITKNSVKGIMSFIFNFETKAIELAKKRNCDGIICGHIHTPIIKKISNIEYMNSGDWVENQSALVLDSNDDWTLIDLI